MSIEQTFELIDGSEELLKIAELADEHGLVADIVYCDGLEDHEVVQEVVVYDKNRYATYENNYMDDEIAEVWESRDMNASLEGAWYE